jgi:hypothetical protein
MSTTHSLQHNILHNNLNNSGWTLDNKNSNNKKFIYKNKHANQVNPYDEFILDYISSYEVAVTVPIPCSSISYRNTFNQRDVQVIQEYLNMHLSNYKC